MPIAEIGLYAAGIYLILINLTAFIVYGSDKNKARRKRWRVPERTLLLLAVVGGSIGALAGMYFFRHKTKKPKFYIGNWVILILQIALCIWLSGIL